MISIEQVGVPQAADFLHSLTLSQFSPHVHYPVNPIHTPSTVKLGLLNGQMKTLSHLMG